MTVHVVQLELSHLTGPESEPHQQQQDGVVPPVDRAAGLGGAEEPLDLKGLRQAAQAVAGHRRHGGYQVPGERTLQIQMT